MDNTKLKNVIKKYQQHLVVDHGIGPNTVDGYARSLSIALRRMRKFAPKPAEIKQHILWMHTRKYSYSHIVNTSIAIEHYARQRGINVKIGRPRKPRRVIKDILTESEVSRIIQSARNLREKAIACLLAYSGMRNREVCNLMVRELDLGSNRIIVLSGKNMKDRIINISSDCTKVLIEYLKSYPRSENEFLFTTLKKRNQLTPGDLRKILRTVAGRQLGTRRVYPHLLRHSLATNLLNRGASLITIKDQLGHVFYESSLVYVNSTAFRNRSEYEFYKPAYM